METHLLRRIEKHLRRYAIPPTRFGREAVRDPRLVLDMRNGREPGARLSARVHRFIDESEARIGQ
ncbi:hypothetical protein [Sphingomonas sp. C3-2]|uniref:hypothetical protein n=1 Tax=Sphingomonas sp. C3-2 TaxID=3062169 RepID=UPI00294AE99E|nr:hypothetical protein [Sphingomonas sp. C3-2]WOK36066.1 hypothetical protein QYC26_13800 [Sphingomonas sp. C3-2]